MADSAPDWLTGAVGGPVRITSGYRDPQHNALVGGVPNSDHLRGQAYDFVPQGMSMADAAARLRGQPGPATKILDEGDHVHVSYKQGQMPQAQGISREAAEALLMGGSDTKAQAPAPAGSPQSGISRQAAEALLLGNTPQSSPAPASAPTADYFPPGDSRNGPAALTVTPGNAQQPPPPPAANPNGLPKRFDENVGITGSLHMPFLQDVLAGGAALEDVAGNALSGRSGLSLSDSYRARMAELKQRQQEFEAKYPRFEKYGWTLGAVPAFEGGAAEVAGTGIKQGLGALMKTGGKTGAITGAIYGAGTPGDEDSLAARGSNALVSGAVGLGTGVTLPVAGKIVSVGGKAVAKIAKGLSEKLGITMHDATRQAENMLMTAFGRDNVDPKAAVEQLSGTGKPLTVMDIAGTNTQRLARKIVTQPGEAGDKITKFLGSRSEDQSGRVLGDITDHLSSNTDVYGLGEKLAEERSAASEPLWKKAMDHPPVTTDRLEQFAGDPDIRAGMNTGIKLAKREALAKGEKFDPNAYAITSFDAAGDPVISGVPTWRTWQAAKEGLDAKIETFRNEVTGQLPKTKEVISLVNLKNSLLKELDAVNPDYKIAREAWAGPSSHKTAMSMGGDAFNADPEEIAKAFSRMSQSEKDFYRIGAARALQDKANSAADSADLSKRLYGNTRLRTQIDTVFGKGAADAFGQAMGQEGRMAATNRFVLGGSNTANKFADAADHGQMVAEDMMHGAMAGGPKGMILHPAMSAIRRSVGSLFDMNPNTATSLADIMTAKGPTAVPTLTRLLEAQAKRADRNALVGRVVSGVNSSAASLAARGEAKLRSNRK